MINNKIVTLLALACLTTEVNAVSIKAIKIDDAAEQDLDSIMNKYDDREKPVAAPTEVHVASGKPKVSASEV